MKYFWEQNPLRHRDDTEPAGNYQSSVPGPDDIHRTQLPNGLIVLSRANYQSPSVVVSGYLLAGGLFDPDEKLGLANFTASALMRGTPKRNFQEIYDALESVGANLGVGGGTHTTVFRGKGLVEDLDLLLELLSQSLRQPAFPLEQVERLRAQMMTGLAIRAQDTGEMASLAFDRLVYRNHPYSRPQEGEIETVQAISREDLINFHSRHYGPRGMVIAVVGGLNPIESAEKVSQALGDWVNPQQPDAPELPPVDPLENRTIDKATILGKSQSDILMGSPGPSRFSEDYLAASLGNNVLGQFGMMGRIGDVVREQSGLAYYASSHLSGGMGPGPWYVSMGVDPENVSQAVDLTLEEIRKFISEPVSEEELSDSQAQYIGRLPLSLESNSGVAMALINLERYQLGLDYYQRYPQLVKAVTREKVLETARRYLDPDKLGIAVAGP